MKARICRLVGGGHLGRGLGFDPASEWKQRLPTYGDLCACLSVSLVEVGRHGEKAPQIDGVWSVESDGATLDHQEC